MNFPQRVDGTFTRVVEYKHFDWRSHLRRFSNASHQWEVGTTIVREFSSDTGEPYYPVPDQRNQVRAHAMPRRGDPQFLILTASIHCRCRNSMNSTGN